MAQTQLKEKLASGKSVLGSWLTMDNEISAELMSRMGFDFLTVDLEHSAIDIGAAQRLVRTVEMNGCASLVRVGENNENLIKRAMDTGAQGVIVPMVKTADDARRAVAAVRYPPHGKRGVGLSRAQGYGLNFADYKRWLIKGSVVVAIIEHIEAMDHLEEILSVEGLDATMIGPYDLSGSMGHPGEFDRPDVMACIKRYQKVCAKFRKPAGFHVVQPRAKDLLKKQKEGYKFLAFGLDTLFLAEGISGQMEQLKKRK